MPLILEETIILVFVVLAVPALAYALERLTSRRIFSRKIIIAIYFIIFFIYLINIEKARRQIREDYTPIAPKFLLNMVGKDVGP